MKNCSPGTPSDTLAMGCEGILCSIQILLADARGLSSYSG